jgi:putative transposase
MTYNPDIHRRRSIRLPDYDYSQVGAYFVTIVTRNRENLFGEIVREEMKLNDMGILVKNEWQRLTSRFHNIKVDEFVVMPNHLHGIICILDGKNVGAWQEKNCRTQIPFFATPLPDDASLPSNEPRLPIPPASGSLGNIAGSFKSISARLINGFRHTPGNPIWQRNYYEHVIRNEKSYDEISAYIANNPAQWEMDKLFVEKTNKYF